MMDSTIKFASISYDLWSYRLVLNWVLSPIPFAQAQTQNRGQIHALNKKGKPINEKWNPTQN